MKRFELPEVVSYRHDELVIEIAFTGRISRMT